MTHELEGALDRIEKAVRHAQKFTQSDSVSLCGDHIDVSTEYDIEQALRDIQAIRDAVPGSLSYHEIIKANSKPLTNSQKAVKILHAITSEASDE